jgi:hypothetical protein
MILRNAIECRKCGDTIESRSVHDFKFCSCGAVFVDGGREYLRWGGSLDDIIDRSEVIEMKEDTQKDPKKV